MPQTVGPLEAMWTIVVVIGLLAGIRRTLSVVEDLRARKRAKRNGLMYMQARNDVRTEIIRLCVMICLVGIALAAVTSPQRHAVWSWQVIVTTSALCLIPATLTYDSIRTEQVRNKLLDTLEERDRKFHAGIHTDTS